MLVGDFLGRQTNEPGSVVVLNDAERRTFKVIELSAAHAPPEHCADQEHQHDAERNQQIEDVHAQRLDRTAPAAGAVRAGTLRGGRMSRNALATTSSELAAMPTPAIQGVSQPDTASGMASRL